MHLPLVKLEGGEGSLIKLSGGEDCMGIIGKRSLEIVKSISSLLNAAICIIGILL